MSLNEFPHLKNEGWYYTNRGKQEGPVSAERLQHLWRNEEIDKDAHVWKPGFKDWVQIWETELAADTNIPPPIAAKFISNSIVWIIAFLPIIFVAFDIFGLRVWKGQINGELAYNYGQRILGWLEKIVIYSIFCNLDRRRLNSAGYGSNYLLASSIVVPVYLFMRASRLGQPPYYAFVWIVCFVIALLG